ncbi:MAG: NFACT RNA binding domain-containing protein [Clostridia bacterium]|nr:NFACT RNA binding domain-containing protein [Clostridia bacterium]
MPFDGLMTRAVTAELQNRIVMGKVDKIAQPEQDVVVFTIHTKTGNVRLLMSAAASHARVHLIENNPVNPVEPYSFCMLLRKYLTASRIVGVEQHSSERIMELSFESMNELGFNVSRKLIIEIMGKHSNIVLVDLESGKIIDSVKRVGFDVNRARQVLPGLKYVYPPLQEKIPFDEILTDQDGLEKLESAHDGKEILDLVSGIAPVYADQLASEDNRAEFMRETIKMAETGSGAPMAWFDEQGSPRDYYFTPLDALDTSFRRVEYGTLSECLEEYFSKKVTANQTLQKANDAMRRVNELLSKKYLKKKRLSEDLIEAENSDRYRLYGELLTANLGRFTQGMASVDVLNYYNGQTVTIPLDVKLSPSKNAQAMYKRYQKAKTAVKEKQVQLEENDAEIAYLESTAAFLQQAGTVEEVENIKRELMDTGYMRPPRKAALRKKAAEPKPLEFVLESGLKVLVGRNNRENDRLTFKMSDKGDIWLHTKDIPGSHVLIKCGPAGCTDDDIREAAGIAAYHSKAQSSENVPVDYVPIRYVKKPQGAKPGMVIFTNNRTIYADPKEGRSSK